ncbi:MAG: isoleucine--tRNA ligase [Elusimicrobiota bacterium]
MDYSKTVNLLQTNFPMKADLPIREPKMVEEWEKTKLYEKIQNNRKNRPVFLLHDGPPYANGDIHMGHALNKVLKDIVVKYKSAAGFRSPYKPGWDCHGLPIEHALFKQLGKNKHQITRNELREKATVYAKEFVEKQKLDFKRLGILGQWDDPYLTLNNDYEAGIVDVFYQLKEAGFVYKGLKPGYWCAYDETALAEAEVEYADKQSDSVFVRFKLNALTPTLSQLGEGEKYILIWTTTPWTLPANRGLAFHPDEKYTVIQKDNAFYIVAEKLKETVKKKIDATDGPVVTFKGKDIVGLMATNPLTRGTSQVVTAGYVTMEDGTGIVHIAPGHGVEDFQVGQQWNLEVASPVDERGCYDKTVGRDELIGKHVLKEANKAVMELLGPDLVFHQTFKHSYPHCWRCKNPIIFRATKQWFMEVSDSFRQTLLKEIEAVTWEPSYGIHRIKGMIQVRPDWCLSRQRHWGAPIAVFYCKGCHEVFENKTLNKTIVELIRTKGAKAYYDFSEEELFKLAGISAQCASCQGTVFEKEMDILDVWFDSGVSWYTVVQHYFSNPAPTKVMYLEGSDQHRGWFQTSLIPSVALQKKAPYDIVLTHGFVVDGKGHKMSKSVGNVVSPQEINQKFGADVLRLWVAMSDYREDVRMSQDIVKHMVDVYRRFRNVFRFLLQNTSDFVVEQNKIPLEQCEEVDQWILCHLAQVQEQVEKAYEANEFHLVLSELNRFVSVTLSGFYLDLIKDILYCEEINSPRRRSAQTALSYIARSLFVLLAPILSFTSEEAYLEFRNTSWKELPESVFLDEIKNIKVGFPFSSKQIQSLNKNWDEILKIRSLVNDELDRLRKEGVLKSSQEALLKFNISKLNEEQKNLMPLIDWPFVLQMADVHMIAGSPQEGMVSLQATEFGKCERCWRYRSDVGSQSVHPTLCGRCVTSVSKHVTAA